MPVTLRKYKTMEVRAAHLLQRISLPLLRWAIGVVFIWFGILKVANDTPVGDFVANTLPWFDRSWLVPALGLFEMAIGIAMIVGRLLVLVCLVMVAHLVGTFLSLVMQPGVTFQNGNLLLLTTEGEFVVKNLVLIAAAIVLAAGFPSHKKSTETVRQQQATVLIPEQQTASVVPQQQTAPAVSQP